MPQQKSTGRLSKIIDSLMRVEDMVGILWRKLVDIAGNLPGIGHGPLEVGAKKPVETCKMGISTQS